MDIIAKTFVSLIPYAFAGALAVGAGITLAYVLPLLLEFLQAAIVAGVDRAAELHALAVSQTAEAIHAVDQAIRAAARALGKTIDELKKIKPFFVFKRAMPRIYAFNKRMILRNPRWAILNWHGDRTRTNANRAVVMAKYGHLRTPTNNSIDEFPFASTLEGGFGAVGIAVPLAENRRQGGYLGAFTRWVLKKPGPFMVVPVGL